jgi:hypothetical protein
VPVHAPCEARVPVPGLLADLLDWQALVDEERHECVTESVRRTGVEAGGFDGRVPEAPPPVPGSERFPVR